MVYVMGWQSRTANLLDSGEAAQVFRGLGFIDVLKLDGGGSYYQSRDGAVSKTAENRRINSVLRWTVREEEPELTEDRVRQIVREELAVQESRLANAPADSWALPYIRQAVEEGIRRVEQLLPVVNACRRQTVSAEHLVLALECGGSDGFSGLSANPALGRAVDLLVKNGGTAILSETTEIFGVEHTLTRRARTPEVGQKLVDHINWWLKYNEGKDCQINGRVSPGNNKGGLANVLEKSLGGAKKGGETALNEVYDYAEKVTEHGLVFMNTPGYDPVATTGQVAGGATMVAFTTGRGSCFGGVPSPVLKLASNTPMYQRMEGDMDINCGVIIDGEKDLDEMGQLIFERILQVASGDRSKSELLGVGENEFVPWPIGVLA